MTLTIFIPFPNSLIRVRNRFVKNGKANFGRNEINGPPSPFGRNRTIRTIRTFPFEFRPKFSRSLAKWKAPLWVLVIVMSTQPRSQGRRTDDVTSGGKFSTRASRVIFALLQFTKTSTLENFNWNPSICYSKRSSKADWGQTYNCPAKKITI